MDINNPPWRKEEYKTMREAFAETVRENLDYPDIDKEIETIMIKVRKKIESDSELKEFEEERLRYE